MSRFFDNAERPQQEEELDIDVAEVERPDVEVPDETAPGGENEPLVIVDENGKEQIIGDPVTQPTEESGDKERPDSPTELVPALDLPPLDDDEETGGKGAEVEKTEGEEGKEVEVAEENEEGEEADETAPLKPADKPADEPADEPTDNGKAEVPAREEGVESPISDEEMDEIVKHEERTDEDDDAMFGEAALAEEDKILDVSGNDEIVEEARQPEKPATEWEPDAGMMYQEDGEGPRSSPAKCCIIS